MKDLHQLSAIAELKVVTNDSSANGKSLAISRRYVSAILILFNQEIKIDWQN